MYRCAAQREVLPGEKLVSSPQMGGNEGMSIGNNPVGESIYREK